MSTMNTESTENTENTDPSTENADPNTENTENTDPNANGERRYRERLEAINALEPNQLEAELRKLKNIKCVQHKPDPTELEFTLGLPVVAVGGPMQSPTEPAAEYVLSTTAWDYLYYGINLIHNWRKVNPRTPYLKSDLEVKKIKTTGPVKDMRTTLEEMPYVFALANNGITLVAANVDVNAGSADTTLISAQFSNRNHHGIFNGLTTSAVLADLYNDALERLVAAKTDYYQQRPRLTALKNFLTWQLRLQTAPLRIRLIELYQWKYSQTISKGLNTSVQVRPRDIEYASGALNDLENAVVQLGLADRYEFKSGEGSKSSTSMDDLITIILIMATAQSAVYTPTSIMSHAASNLQKYKRMMELDQTKGIMATLQEPDRLGELLNLYDHVAFVLSERLNYDPAVQPVLKRITQVPYMGTLHGSAKYRARRVHTIPIYTAFTANMNKDGSWKLPLESVQERIAEAAIDSLYDNIIKDLQAEATSATRASDAYYQVCLTAANNAIRDVEIEQGLRVAATTSTGGRKKN